jgi:hypothetical protein
VEPTASAVEECRKRALLVLRAKVITDMKEQGRDAKEVSGQETDAMVNQVYDRRRVRRVPR